MKIQATDRGFPIAYFKDRYNTQCHIQKSSLAGEDCIWLGINEADPQILVPGEGWKPFPIPKEVFINTAMHLTQDQVRELLPMLQRFADTGEIQPYGYFNLKAVKK